MDAVAPYFKTVISGIAADNISITPADGGCLVTLGSDAVEWTATLYNSNGVTVAQQQGNGNIVAGHCNWHFRESLELAFKVSLYQVAQYGDTNEYHQVCVVISSTFCGLLL